MTHVLTIGSRQTRSKLRTQRMSRRRKGNFISEGRSGHANISCCIRQGLGCCTILGLMEVRFPKWFLRVKKGVINLFLCISMAYNVISCIEIAKNTQTLKIADFTM